MPSAIRAQVGSDRSFCVLEAGTAQLANHGSLLKPMNDWYDLSPIAGGGKALEDRWRTKKSINRESNVSIGLTAYTNYL
jgi:hypothetical protein